MPLRKIPTPTTNTEIMKNDNREDYLLDILRLSDGVNTVKTNDIAKMMNVAPASVTEMLNVLNREGLVNYEKYKGVSLTEKGLSVAKKLRKKHHIMEYFLINILNLSPELAHEEACAFEHSFSDEAAYNLSRIMGISDDDDSCTVCKSNIASVPLSNLSPRQSGTVSFLSSENPAVIREIIRMGIVPGKIVSLVEVTDGVFVVESDSKSFAVSEETASAILVIQR